MVWLSGTLESLESFNYSHLALGGGRATKGLTNKRKPISAM